jgi:phosphoserine phosphatase RsbU/P
MQNILLVDDDFFIRTSLKKLLEVEGYAVLTEGNANDAIRSFDEKLPDIVLLDLKMPDMNGIELLKIFKKKSPLVEIIMITGHGDLETAIQTLKEGAFGYIQKPIDFSKLFIEILKAFDKQKLQIQINNYHANLEMLIKEKTEELNKRIIAEEALRTNINEARIFQSKLIKTSLPKIYNINFSTCYLPYDKVGGDFFNIILKEDNLLFYIADISGHGVSSAIISSFIKALLDNWIKNDGIYSPLALINLLKKSLHDEEIFKEDMVTVFIGNLNTGSLELTYLSAGHHLPIVISRDEEGNFNSTDLEKTFKPLTTLLEYDSYEEKTVTLKNHTKFLLYSDGLIEWKDGGNRITGNDFLQDFITENGLSKRTIHEFVGRITDGRQDDDISYILMEIDDEFEKNYFCDLGDYNFIMNDITSELSRRYTIESRIFLKILNCLEEAVVNAVEHGNKNSREKNINLKIRFEKENIVFIIKDDGEGFDWQKTLSDKKIQKNKIRERGFLVMKHFSDEFHFNDKGNELTISFRLYRNTGDPKK